MPRTIRTGRRGVGGQVHPVAAIVSARRSRRRPEPCQGGRLVRGGGLGIRLDRRTAFPSRGGGGGPGTGRRRTGGGRRLRWRDARALAPRCRCGPAPRPLGHEMASSGCWTVVKAAADRWAPTRWRVQLHTVKLASILGGNFRLGSSRRRGGVAPDDQWRISPECVHQDQSDDLAVRTESKP